MIFHQNIQIFLAFYFTKMTQEDLAELEETGSHEDYWTFTQVSQWGDNWPYFDGELLNQVRNYAVQIRQIGIKTGINPKIVHIAQMIIWRFYLVEKISEYKLEDIYPLAFESAAQILESPSPIKNSQNPRMVSSNESLLHFKLLKTLNFNIRIHHPSDYLHHFINSSFTTEEIRLAECIISDSFLCTCCLVHKPAQIAEGAAIMAAGMTENPGSVIPRTSKAISFIKDMQWFYNQSLNRTVN